MCATAFGVNDSAALTGLNWNRGSFFAGGVAGLSTGVEETGADGVVIEEAEGISLRGGMGGGWSVSGREVVRRGVGGTMDGFWGCSCVDVESSRRHSGDCCGHRWYCIDGGVCRRRILREACRGRARRTAMLSVGCRCTSREGAWVSRVVARRVLCAVIPRLSNELPNP
jgi:hypothetical protein